MDAETVIRAAGPKDFDAIRTVNFAAFKGAGEGELVERLRDDADVVIELVAAGVRDVVIGHILFSHLPIQTPDGGMTRAAALAPMAVLPVHQGAGVGSALVRAGLAACAEIGVAGVVVLGHPRFYARFGFSAALARHLQAPYSGDAFMALELTPGALRAGGTVRYARAFGAL